MKMQTNIDHNVNKFSGRWLVYDSPYRDDVQRALNSGTYENFRYHWSNYELNAVLDFTPTKKQYEKLKDCFDFCEVEPGHWFDVIKKICETKACKKIWGQECDIMTASYMKQIVEKLNETNQKKMLNYPFPVALDIMWKLVAKAGKP
jgi:hypothetical protein